MQLSGRNRDDAATETTDILWSRFTVSTSRVGVAYSSLRGHSQQSIVLISISIVPPALESVARHHRASEKPAGGNSDYAIREAHDTGRSNTTNDVTRSKVTQVVPPPTFQGASDKNCAGVKRARDVQGGGATDPCDTDWQ